MTAVYKLTKGQHCKTINIHDYLTQNTEIENSEDDKFTILINTWQRDKCLIQSVNHYLQCDDVAQIRIIWSDPSNDIPEQLNEVKQSLNNKERLIFDLYKDNKLTNRFKYNEHWITNAIFQTDDDIMFSCELISNAYKLWQLLPDYMIGFAAREPYDEYKTKDLKSMNMHNQFYFWDYAFTKCEYSMLFPTLGGFMHKKYYQMYTEDDVNGIKDGWKSIKDTVNEKITAEDISMSLFYTFTSGYPPIAVTVPESELYIDEFLACQEHKSLTMHTNSEQKRTSIYVDTLKVLGYDENKFDLIDNQLWVDVMPLSDQKCWTD